MKKIYIALREILEKKPGIYSSITFILLVIITTGASFRVYDLTVAEERQKAFYAGDAFRDQMELTLNHGLSATQTIALMIEHGSLPASFEQVAEKILHSYPVLNAVELGPNGIVSHVYPYEENKKAIGFNILGDSIQQAEAKDAIKKQKLIFAGPLNLVQGGIGVVGRLPVFITNGHGKRFWGFSLVVIKIDRLLTLAKSDELRSKGYDFQLRRTNTASSMIDTFSNKHLTLVDPVILKVNVPNGHWELLVAPITGWNAWGETIPFAASRFALSCILGLFVWYVGKQPEKLSKLVSKRTEELKFSDAKFQSYVENAPNIITIIDSHGTIKYLNKIEPGTVLSDYSAKNIFDVILPEHHKNVREALDTTLQTQAMSFYLTSASVNDQTYWYENMVSLLNPSNAKGDLIITSTNITKRKKIEEEIRQKSEENKFLADASPLLSECATEESVYSLISTLLLRLIPESNIFVMKTSPDGQRSTLMNIGGVESSILSYGISVLQFNPVGMSFDNAAGYADLICKPRLHKFNGGLYDVAMGVLPKFAAEQIEKLLHVSAFYSIGIAQENSYFGYIHIFTKKDLAVQSATIESFVHQCHLALSKIISQRAMFEEAQRRRIMMNTSSDGMAIINQDHAVVECNPRFAEMLGYAPDEMILMHTWDWEAKMTEDEIRKNFRDLTTIDTTFETQHRRKDGTVYDVEVGASGTIVGNEPMVFVVCRDITSRKNSENALRESENRYRNIVENLQQAYYESNKMSIFTYCNPGLIILSGYSEQELLASSSFRIVANEHRQMVIDSYKKWLAEKQTDMSLEFMVQTKNGNKYWVEQTTHFTFDEHGRFVKATNFVKNITERKVSEEKLRVSEEYNKALVNTIPDLLFVHDSTGKIVDYHSPSSIPLLLSPEYFLGKHFREFLPPDVIVIVEEGFRQALQTKEMSMYTYSLDLPGGKRHYEARLLMIDDDKVLNIIRDITEKVTAENEIKLLNADLENRVTRRTAQLTEAVAELEAFSYSVSHDLRAPLRSIDGYTSILSERYGENFDEEGKRLLTNVHTSIDKMDRLIKGLLDLSRAGRGELRFAEYSLEPFILTIFEECSTAEQRARMTFTVLPLPMVTVDLLLIQQVWTNLISNAVKYSGKQEHPHIEIGATKEIERVIFYVRDNGAGFDPKYSNKLFGIFQRLHVDDEFKGLGIGLSIVKRIVQRHGGTVWAEGKKNEGATFYFSIPTIVQE